MRSNYLEEMITVVTQESKETSHMELEEITSQTNKLNISWKKKILLENYFMPSLCILLIWYVFQSAAGVDFIFTLAPLIMVSSLIICQSYMNYKLQRIDLSLNLTLYGNRQLKIYNNQLILFKLFNWIIYPVFIILIIAEIYHALNQGSLPEKCWIIIIKTLGLGGIYWHERKSVKELKKQVRNLQ